MHYSGFARLFRSHSAKKPIVKRFWLESDLGRHRRNPQVRDVGIDGILET